MKTIYLNLQSKGGAGKSMLTYLHALKNQSNPQIAFVDLDNSTRTSTHQLLFINRESFEQTALQKEIDTLNEQKIYAVSENEVDASQVNQIQLRIEELSRLSEKYKNLDRIFSIDINDSLKRIDREKFFDVIESLNATDFSEIYIDFGAPESEQFPQLLSFDFSVTEFKEFEQSLNAKFVFNIVVAGGAMYNACFDYLTNLQKLIANQLEVRVYANLHFFFNELQQIDHLRQHCKATNVQLIEFGQFNTQQSSGRAIIENIKQGKGLSDITSFAAKSVLKRTLTVI